MRRSTQDRHKAFISFDVNDSQLAHQLKDALGKKNVLGYLFDSEQEYDSTLHDKITNAIDESRVLIAIITNGSNSPSVHEEIGYAFAKGKSVIIMLENNAKDGVLSHEREHEPFSKDMFDNSVDRILQYVQARISKTVTSVRSTEFLKTRGLLDNTASNFCMTPNSTNIENAMMERKPTAHPVVLFSACPINLIDEIPINSPQYADWLEQFSHIPVSGRQIEFLNGSRKIEFEKTTYYYDNIKHYIRYVEIHSNGFVEQGQTRSLMDTHNFESIGKKTMLHHTWIAGTFWAFLVFCREHYMKHKYSDEIDVFLSIRDARALMLAGFPSKPQPGQLGWTGRLPHTDKQHLQITERVKTEALSEERIEEITRKFANKIANAYGLESTS